MNKVSYTVVLLLVILALVASGCTAPVAEEAEMPAAPVAPVINPVVPPIGEDPASDFGAKSALLQGELTTEAMLRYAIEDEYLARQEYESIMAVFGEQNPFSNIIVAEERHIELLKEIYQTYGYDLPEDLAIDHVVIPESIVVALEVGVAAEIDNIAMYEKFLEQELPDDIRAVFVELRDGSISHLAAFERGERGNGSGK